jgi:bifunctional N-acetylglucosamine-1-phosphate-uridyltransferase/glucosamine-1-phosphate-acetyltransferase GlmU-like protein
MLTRTSIGAGVTLPATRDGFGKHRIAIGAAAWAGSKSSPVKIGGVAAR